MAGEVASLCVVTAVAQAPRAPTGSQALTREQILALLENEVNGTYKIASAQLTTPLSGDKNAVWRKPLGNMMPIGAIPAIGLIRATQSKRSRRARPLGLEQSEGWPVRAIAGNHQTP